MDSNKTYAGNDFRPGLFHLVGGHVYRAYTRRIDSPLADTSVDRPVLRIPPTSRSVVKGIGEKNENHRARQHCFDTDRHRRSGP